MKSRFGALSLIFLTILMAVSAPGAAAASNPLWQVISQNSSKDSARPSLILAPDKYTQFRLDEPTMRASLAKAPKPVNRSGAITAGTASVSVPLPSGEMVDLVIEETAIMEAELAAQYPAIKAFVAYAKVPQIIDGRLDFTEQGFHAMFSTEQGVVMIDPRTDGNGARSYISYYKHDYHPIDKAPMSCHVTGELSSGVGQPLLTTSTHSALASRSGSQLSTYRLAMAATGEYTQYQGGTVALALSAIVTTVNRVNSIYERDMAIHLQLVNNNNLIIYTNATTDPYDNDNTNGVALTQNQSNLDAVIGSANYDIGHVVSTGGGGLAQLRVPCNASYKAMGVTGTSQPVGDPFDIDYVAHEMGHQFGGNHTFNGTTGSCSGGNRNASTAWEPGSGTTIMAYAGICGGEDLQSHSDSLFHAGSITEIINFITSGGGASCGVRTSLSNTAPIANAGANYTIPANTPFVLTGSASDADSGNILTYAWDEMNLGTASTASNMADQGTRPLFRSFVPSTSPVRYFPKLQSILNNSSDVGERLPTTNRSLNFRLTVRDQRGGVADSDVALTVSASAGPFRISAPNGGESLATTSTVTWNVANTNSAPVNCPTVTISLSTDGGASFPVTLLASTTNNGSAPVTFPVGSSSTARIKIQCANNLFFALSSNNFTFNNIAQTTMTLTVNASGAANVAIIAAPASYGGTAPYSKTGITSGTIITLTAPVTVGSVTFGSWSGCDSPSSVTCTVTMNATKTVTANYASSLLNQTITFTTTAATVGVGGTASISATASSGLTVTFSSTTPGICGVSGNTVAGVAPGTCVIAANQAGNSRYSPAPQVMQNMVVTAGISRPDPPTIISIQAGSASAAVKVASPGNTGGAPISRYTATCTAGQAARTASANASPVTVRNLTGGVIYQCAVTATNSGGFTSIDSASMAVTPNNSLTPILMLLLD